MTMRAFALRDAEIVRERRFVQPGQVFVASEPAAVTTILGSCVAVCLWDGQRRVGGLNHFMLPFSAGTATRSARFGNVAMDELFERMKAAGARLPFLRAFVFGGSCMFGAMQAADHLGQKNADLAIDHLTRRGVEIAKVDVGGNRGRKVIFYTDEGSVCLKTI
jgi:chemotaxis protein CheD